MSLFLDKPWRNAVELHGLPGHMGVFELADAEGTVLYVGYAGGRSRYGLRSEIGEALTRMAAELGACRCRYEVTTAYLTRWQELLMAHRARHGTLPSGNSPVPGLGRLSPP